MGTFETHKFISGTQAPVEAGRKGGSVTGSPAKSLAATLRNLERSKKITPESKEWLWNMMNSDEMSSYQILDFITKCATTKDTGKDKRELAKLLLDWRKMHHGSKETKHTVDVTSREYKFVVEVQANARDTLETDREAMVSVPVPDGPNNN